MGATFDGDGVNFAVFSAHAQRMILCLFDAEGRETRLDLPERDGDIWHGYVPRLKPGQAYGFRADGPYRPGEGHRFNINKLLVDPYARKLSGQPTWHHAIFGYDRDSRDDRSFDATDSAAFVPRSIVADAAPDLIRSLSAAIPIEDTVIYEAHVKGLTALHPGVTQKGTFLGLASDPILDHLTKLGVTAIELLPAQAFIDDLFLVEKGLTNYWGYQTLGFFAPDLRYLSNGDIFEFRQMVDRFHGAGLEVLMDVVYNHTCEGNELGPTLSFRGLDNASYYRLADDRRFYVNDTGTGNTVNADQPMVLRLIMDSLRYWVQVMGVDGFRFDLGATLGRTASGFEPGAALFDAMRQDPVLSDVKLIAEPWDIGPGGYRLGQFPPPFLEWNDAFRDNARRFWRGDAEAARHLAGGLLGSAQHFDHSGRAATSSVNLLTAHDGFTLEDVVSYAKRHNHANLEGNRDGHGENFSDNLSVEGPATDPVVRARRAKRKRNMLATLFLSQGTPMLLAGDELGHTQLGNNNAYCQDNETSWIDWARVDEDLMAFTQYLIAFRKAHPALRQKRFLHARERSLDGRVDLFWWREDGAEMTRDDWTDPARRLLAVELRMASDTPEYAESEAALFIILNAGEATKVVLPETPEGESWVMAIDTDQAEVSRKAVAGTLSLAEESVAVLTLSAAN